MLAKPELRSGFALAKRDGSHPGPLEAEVDAANPSEERQDIHASPLVPSLKSGAMPAMRRLAIAT